ncbi:MAG: hypothetical protein ACREM8_09120, partial [Vulcanimicrobiaceae bacterium]
MVKKQKPGCGRRRVLLRGFQASREVEPEARLSDTPEKIAAAGPAAALVVAGPVVLGPSRGVGLPEGLIPLEAAIRSGLGSGDESVRAARAVAVRVEADRRAVLRDAVVAKAWDVAYDPVESAVTAMAAAARMAVAASVFFRDRGDCEWAVGPVEWGRLASVPVTVVGVAAKALGLVAFNVVFSKSTREYVISVRNRGAVAAYVLWIAEAQLQRDRDAVARR